MSPRDGRSGRERRAERHFEAVEELCPRLYTVQRDRATAPFEQPRLELAGAFRATVRAAVEVAVEGRRQRSTSPYPSASISSRSRE